jgi:hypothetical protein
MGKSYSADSVFGDDVWAKAQVYSLSLIFKLWSKPHYRSPSFQQDMLDNLKNVAIPGTGIPLSYFCGNYLVCLLFVFFANPLVCLFGAVHKAAKEQEEADDFSLPAFARGTLRFYGTHLLHPDDWFSLWRLNCRLATYHSQVTPASACYYARQLFLVSSPSLTPCSLSLACRTVWAGDPGPRVPPGGQVDVPHRGQGARRARVPLHRRRAGRRPQAQKHRGDHHHQTPLPWPLPSPLTPSFLLL